METRLIQVRDTCLPRIMEESERPCLLPIFPNRESSEESASRNGNNIFSSFRVARAAIVPKGITNKYSWPNLAPKN